MLEHSHKVYLLELIKFAEKDNSLLLKLMSEIGTHGMVQIGEARKRLEAEINKRAGE